VWGFASGTREFSAWWPTRERFSDAASATISRGFWCPGVSWDRLSLCGEEILDRFATGVFDVLLAKAVISFLPLVHEMLILDQLFLEELDSTR